MDHKVPECRCPNCKASLNAAAGPNERPSAGDFSLCIRCGYASVFDEQLKLRSPTPVEAIEIYNDLEIRWAKKKIEALNAQVAREVIQ